VALAAFLGCVMVHVGGMTRQAERAPRRQLGDRGLLMAVSAAGVGVHRRCVSVGDLRGSVTSRAVGLASVVIVVAGDARFGSWLRFQGYGGGVTLRACGPHMYRVFEDHWTRPGCMTGNSYLERQWASGIQLA